ncbi:MAG: hypothetical protein RLZZ623_3160 [Actinomycetota bacterium]
MSAALRHTRPKRPKGGGIRAIAFGFGVASVAIGLPACALVSGDSAHGPADSTVQDVASVAGWTRIATTPSYLVVANVLPGEEMYSKTQVDAQHPLVGELAIKGMSMPTGPNSRHVEAHVYDRTTGKPLSDVDVTLVVVNRTTGQRDTVMSTLMQDINIGALDVHYGNNLAIPGGSSLSLVINVNDEEVTLDGDLL